MLAAMKKLMKSWVAAGILGLLIITLAFFGFNQGTDPFAAMNGGTWIVKAGGREAGPDIFKMFWNNEKAQLEQQYQTQIPDSEIVKAGLDKQLLERFMASESLGAMLEKMGLKAPDALVDEVLKEQLARVPGLFDPITGQINQQRYAEVLQNVGTSEKGLRTDLGGKIVLNQFYGSVTAGLEIPRIYSAVRAGYGLEERDFSYFVITPQSLGPVPPPTEAEMEAFLKQNASRLMRKEMRVLSVVRFQAADYAGQVTADPAEVQKRFDFRKKSLSAPELRSYVQIPAKSERAAADAAARLKKGEDPAAIAKALGVELLSNEDKPRASIFDKALGDAIFALPSGGVSPAIKTELGFAAVKITKITPEKTATLEEHREQIEQDVITQAAANKAYAQATAYDAAHGQGATLPQAAAKVGAKVITVGPVDDQGRGPANQPVDISPEVLKAAFALPAGADSGLVELSAGDQFAVRVERILPPAPPPLAEVREELSALMMRDKLNKAVTDRAKVASDRLRKGESVEAVAASLGYSVVKLDKATRANARDHMEALGEGALGALYEGSRGQVLSVPVQGKGIVVGRIETVRSGSQEEIAMMANQGRQVSAREVFGDADVTISQHAKEKMKPKSDRNRALTALGLNPADYAEKKPEDAGEADKAKK
jgi:peptidyl-prolyl cis-trans isomerase D